MLPNKWAFNRSRDVDEKPVRYSKKLVIRGNLDTDEMFAPVVGFHRCNAFTYNCRPMRVACTLNCLQLRIPAKKNAKNCVYDADEIPEWISISSRSDVQKNLYRLKESSRIRYGLLEKEMKEIVWRPMLSATCVFKGNDVLVLCNVDALWMTRSNLEPLKALQKSHA